jgi:hypothetical protein
MMDVVGAAGVLGDCIENFTTADIDGDDAFEQSFMIGKQMGTLVAHALDI